jgi:hypothetical protein
MSAGDVVLLGAGEWCGLQCQEPMALGVCNWWTPGGGCQAFNAIAQAWLLRNEGNARAAALYELGSSVLHPNYRKFLYWVTQEHWNCTTGGLFSFDCKGDDESVRKIKSTSWRYATGLKRSAKLESDRGMALANLAAAARVFQDKRNCVVLEDVPPRNWGRLIKWCQASLGTPQYTAELDEAQGPPKKTKADKGWGGRQRGAARGTRRSRRGEVQEQEE